MSKLKEKAAKYLKDHPGAEVHGVPTDPKAFLFLRKQDAKAHAITLKTNEVVSFGTKASNIEVKDAQTISGNQLTEKAKAEKAKAEKAKAEKAKTEKAKTEKAKSN